MNQKTESKNKNTGREKVKYWMDLSPLTIRPETPLAELLERTEEKKQGRFIVVNNQDQVLGIVTKLDLKEALPSPVNTLDRWELRYMFNEILAKDIMTKTVLTTLPDTQVRNAVHIMMDNDISGLPVINSSKQLIGMLTMKCIVQSVFCSKESGDDFSYEMAASRS